MQMRNFEPDSTELGYDEPFTSVHPLEKFIGTVRMQIAHKPCRTRALPQQTVRIFRRRSTKLQTKFNLKLVIQVHLSAI